ncbi:hypothetical protein [Microcoleus sp. D3_18a_C4]|uniref:hypothetical protein n=1 Tax=Microcoleus sp. D3_18a_C4 TaxID=3055332 RepID=UPI002FD06986
MTSNSLPTWQQSLNQKLVRRLNNPLTEPGIINNEMARKIIERSPDLLDRLPLLAQQMQRWSTIVDLESEQMPIVYVEHQQQINDSSLLSSDPNEGKKQVPVVKAKLVQVKADSALQNKEYPLVDARSQPTASVLTPDNSLPNLPNNSSSETETSPKNSINNTSYISNPSISITPISADSVNSIQRKLDNEQLSPQNESIKLEPEIPVVYERSQPRLSDETPEKPLVNNLSNNIFPTRESSAAERSEQPLGKLSNNISKTRETSADDINNHIFSAISLTPIGESTVNPTQRRGESSDNVNLPVVQVKSEQLSSQSEWVKLEPEPALVYERSHPKLSEEICEQPLVNLSNNREALMESSLNNIERQTSPSISITPIDAVSANPIQRRVDGSDNLNLPVVQVKSEQLSSQSEWVKLEPETSLVYERSHPKLSEEISEQPLVNLSNKREALMESSSTNIERQTSPSISITPIDAVSANPIQRRVDGSDNLNLPVVQVHSEQISPQSEWVKLEPETSLVYERSHPKLSNFLPEQPLVSLSNNISNTRETSTDDLNNQTSPSGPVVPISPISTPSIQRRSDNSAFVYSQPLSPKLTLNEPPILIKQFERNHPSVVSKESEKITQSPISNSHSYNLPVVQVDSERSPPELQPLIFSASPIAKQKVSSLNGKELNIDKKLIAPANNGTSSTHQETFITHTTTSERATIASTSSSNSQLSQVNQTTHNSIAGVNIPPQIDVDALADKVERKIMRRLVVESERRGKKQWH